MSTTEHHNIIILGSGPAGLTAAIYTARANFTPLVIHGPMPGGQLTTTTEVENFPGFPEGMMGPDLMLAFQKQAERFGASIVTDTVNELSLDAKPFVLKTNSKEYTCDALILATGASPRYLGLEAEKELMGFGVSTCATCDGAFFRDKVIMVIGGGDSACEEALFLTKFGSKVLLVHRRDELRASKIMQDRVKSHEKIEILWNKQLKDIAGSKKEGVTSVSLIHSQTKEEEQVECQAVFLAIGHTPNSELFKGQLELDENGYVVPQTHSTKTSIEGVFVCGDLQDHNYRQAITAAGSGCMAAIDASRYLEG